MGSSSRTGSIWRPQTCPRDPCRRDPTSKQLHRNHASRACSPAIAVPIVAAFEAEHRAFTEEQVRLLASVAESARAPLELGPEASGTRYAFPDRTFSAVFDLQPNAMQQLSEGSQGQSTSKTLGIKDAVGFTRNITCMSSAAAPEGTAEDTATKILKGMGAKTTKRVRVSLYDAWEAQVATAQSEALVRVVVRPAGLCLIIAEYPHAVADTTRDKAAQFVASVRIDTPEGVPTALPSRD